MRTFFFTMLMACLLIACNNGDKTSTGSSTASTGDITKTWKLGVALWTFHTFDFPQSLARVDSSGLVYIEPNTFHKAGTELKDSLILQLSPAGIEKLQELITKRGLTAASIYIAGDSTILSWKKQFDIARQLGVKFVTAEPPITLLDAIDSLAGAYGIKVAIHEHGKVLVNTGIPIRY